MENITTQLLAALRIHLETHPIDFQDRADNMIDFLFYHYSEVVPLSTINPVKNDTGNPTWKQAFFCLNLWVHYSLETVQKWLSGNVGVAK